MLMLEYLFLWFLFYSFAGWVYESILVSVSERRLVNRGFLNGPICPIYGCGAVLAIVLLHDLHNPFAVFLISSIGACMLEYVTSWGMEKLFHARWWDYSHRRFNIQGRICLLGAIVFGLLGVLITDVIQPEVVQDWSDSSQEILANMQATAASILNKQQRRMINAFPRLRFTDSIKYSKIIETLHEMLRRK